MIRRLVRWHVLPPSCVPDSCIVNIYEPDDCIPLHMILLGHSVLCHFSVNATFFLDLSWRLQDLVNVLDLSPFPCMSGRSWYSMGMVLTLLSSVPAVPTKRISITFRKMDERKQPIGFVPVPYLQTIQPLLYVTDEAAPSNHTSGAGSHSEQQMNGSIKGEVFKEKSGYKFNQGHLSALGASYHRDGDSEISVARGRNSVERWFEPKTDRGLLVAPPYRADAYTSRQWLQEEGSASWIGRSQQSGGFRMIAGEEEPFCTPEVGGLSINRRYGVGLSRQQFSLSSVKVQ